MTLAPAPRPEQGDNARQPADSGLQSSLFDTAEIPPHGGSRLSVFASAQLAEFGVDQWEQVRDSGIPARNVSALGSSRVARQEFLDGARLLGLVGGRKKLAPQQLLMSDMLDHGHKLNAVLYPRRSAKSTTLIAKALGRALAREDYRGAILTMTTGKAGRSRFAKDVVPLFERAWPDPKTSPFKVMKSAGQEGILCRASGGFLVWLSSIDDLRGEAFDLVVLDEAGEPEPEKVEDALAAGLPTLDTRGPEAQLVVAGTAGSYRDGNLLWDMLELGRAGEAGIAEFAAPESTSLDDLETWDLAAPIVSAAHPGVNTLTTLESIRDNWKTMKPERFMAEYLSIFGIGSGVGGIIKPDVWGKLADTGPIPASPPARFQMAIAVHRDQTAASIVAAWRDPKHRAHMLVLAHDRGTSWVAGKAYDLAVKYKVPVVHDSMGVVLVETEALARRRPSVKLAPQTTKNITTAAALTMKDIENGTFVHHNQPDLNEAARLAVKRRILSAWGFGGGDVAEDITALEAGAMALRAYDQDVPRIPLKPNF